MSVSLIYLSDVLLLVLDVHLNQICNTLSSLMNIYMLSNCFFMSFYSDGKGPDADISDQIFSSSLTNIFLMFLSKCFYGVTCLCTLQNSVVLLLETK